MAFLIIPTDDTLSFYQEEVDLDNVTFRLVFKYNPRDQSWYFNVLDAAGNLLRAGVRIVDSWPLLRLWVDTNRPAGQLFCIPNGNLPRPPSIFELGDLYDFIYVETGTT